MASVGVVLWFSFLPALGEPARVQEGPKVGMEARLAWFLGRGRWLVRRGWHGSITEARYLQRKAPWWNETRHKAQGERVDTPWISGNHILSLVKISCIAQGWTPPKKTRDVGDVEVGGEGFWGCGGAGRYSQSEIGQNPTLAKVIQPSFWTKT